MTQVHFTLETEDIQSLIDQSVKDNAAKQILQTVFNQLMDGDEQIIFKPQTMNDQTIEEANATAIMKEN